MLKAEVSRRRKATIHDDSDSDSTRLMKSLLTFEASDMVKRSRRRTAYWNMAAGAGVLFLLASYFLSYGMESQRAPLVFCGLVLGGPRLFVGMRSFYLDFFRRGIHRRVIANSRTLAIKVGGKPAVFIKRENCVALGPCGFYLLFHDGASIPLSTHFSDEIDSFQDQFLKPLMRRWWPNLDELLLEPACFRDDPYLSEDTYALPIRFEATPFEKRDSVLSIARPLLLGLVTVLLGTLGLTIPMSELFRGLVILSLMAGAMVAIGCLHTLRRQWILGEIHTSIVLNSRTLAIVRPGGATSYFKRVNCRGAREGGTILDFNDGRQVHLHLPGIDRAHGREKLLRYVFRLWWPEIPFSKVAMHHGSIPPIWLITSWLLLAVGLFLGGMAFLRLSGAWAMVTGAALAFSAYGALLMFLNRWARSDPSAPFPLHPPDERSVER